MESSVTFRSGIKYYLILLVFIVLLFIFPQYWFENTAFDACGDDPKLQFYVPQNYLSDLSINTWSSYNALSVNNLPYPNYLFTLIVFIFKKAGFLPGQIEKIFYGFIFSLGFLFTFLFIKELLRFSNIRGDVKFWAQVLGGLSFVFSPLVQFSDWIARLSSTIFSIFLYPALLYFLLLAINKRSIKLLLPGAFLAGIFSFSIYTPVPWLFAFIIGAFVFLLVYFFFYRSHLFLIFKYLLLYLIFIIALNLPWIIVLLNSIFFNKSVPMLSSGQVSGVLIKEGANFIKGIAFNSSPLYTLLMLPSRDFVGLGSIFRTYFYYKYIIIFLLWPVIISLGLIFSKTKEKIALLLAIFPAVVLGYLITVNITDIGIDLFSLLIAKIPGFIMFRNYYGKFSIAFSFFYSLALGVSLAIILARIKKVFFKVFICSLLLGIIVLTGSPLLTGKMIGVSPSAGIHERLCPVIPQSHFEALKIIRQDKKNSRVFIFPISFAQYMCFKGSNNQYYVAVPFIKAMTGHDEFGGIWSFTNLTYNSLPRIVSGLIADYDFENLYKILWLMNVNYIYLYEKIAIENAQMFLFKYSFIDKMKFEFLKALSGNRIKNLEEVKLYSVSYREKPSHILAKSLIIEVDDYHWLSKAIYTDYLSPAKKPMIVFNTLK
jgi:hypothetical protein